MAENRVTQGRRIYEAAVGILGISGQYLRKKNQEIPEGDKALFSRERGDIH